MDISDSVRKILTEDVEFPIKVIEDFVNNIGGRVQMDPALMFDTEGRVRRADDTDDVKFVISIAPNLPEDRKRFTIAHELGHLILHMGYKDDDQAKWDKSKDMTFAKGLRSDDETEKEAEEFAFEFLMPAEKYKKKLYEISGLCGSVDIRQIAEYFNVSSDVAMKRGRDLGLII